MSVNLKNQNLPLQKSVENAATQLEILRDGLVQVSRTGQGVDTELDRLLESLRKSICDPGNNSLDTSALLTAIEERQNTLVHKRTQFASKSAKAMRSLMGKIEFPAEKNVEISHLVDTINTNQIAMLELPELLSELAQSSGALKDGNEDSVSKSNLLSVLKLKAELLLAQLSIPESLEGEYRNLQNLLETASSIFNINEFFDVLSSFLVDLLTIEQSHLDQYLRNQATPFSAIDTLLQESDAQFSESKKIQRQFDKKLNSGFDSIRNGLNKTKNNDKLRQKLTQEMSELSQEFINYNHEKFSLENNLIEKYQKMKYQFDELQKNHQFAVEEIELYRTKSLTDTLTRLPNRAAWEDQLKMEWERAQRYKSQLSLAVVDIDFFKKINDIHGHLVGDNVLRAIALQLKKYTRSTDFLSRYGGEEFTILLPETNLQDAILALDKLRRKIAKSQFFFLNKPVKVTVSIGISQYRTGDSLDQLFSRADEAMYSAKYAGRNQVKTEHI